MVEHVGCAQDPDELEALQVRANDRLQQLRRQPSLFPQKESTKAKLTDWKVTGYHQVLGSVYDTTGFPENLLRDLIVARIVYPKSKLATIRFLNQTLGVPATRGKVYRFLDTLDKDELTEIAFNFVSDLNQGLNLVFYDVTTLYFESSREDILRQKGYSKDHRHDMPQILIGLFVDQDGFPFDFDYFEGKTFEGHTFPTVIQNLQEKHSFENLTVVADAGMLSNDNLDFLEEQDIGYIVGARLRNLSQSKQKQIVDRDYSEPTTWDTRYNNRRLIVSYSTKRANKDRQTRERKIKKLKDKLKKQQSVVRKSKYIKTGKNEVLGIDEDKIKHDAKYDGLRGYFTNTELPANTVIEHYHQLWQVEKAFRMSKSDLRERPVYHSKPDRIKAHLLLCFVSLLVMKEAERVLKLAGYSLKQAIELLSRVGTGKVRVGKVTLELETDLDNEIITILNLFVGHWNVKDGTISVWFKDPREEVMTDVDEQGNILSLDKEGNVFGFEKISFLPDQFISGLKEIASEDPNKLEGTLLLK